jgi:hypothetical protein
MVEMVGEAAHPFQPFGYDVVRLRDFRRKLPFRPGCIIFSDLLHMKAARQDLPPLFIRDWNIRDQAAAQGSSPSIQLGRRRCPDTLIVIE